MHDTLVTDSGRAIRQCRSERIFAVLPECQTYSVSTQCTINVYTLLAVRCTIHIKDGYRADVPQVVHNNWRSTNVFM